MRKLFSCLIILILLFLCLAFVWSQKWNLADFFSDVQRQAVTPVPVEFNEIETADKPSIDSEIKSTPELAIESIVEPESSVPIFSSSASLSPLSTPSEFNLAVPFTSQTPLSNWDATHEETCEEAALYMVHEFYKGTPAGKIDVDVAEAEIIKIVEFEKVLFGFFESTTATQIAVLAEQMYGYERVEVISDPTIDDFKKYISLGYPVIVPAAGRLLGNPNFTGEGPLYHALVLKGYTETTFITNDPGTRRGADYQYSFDTIMSAMHDWNGGDVLNGAKVAIIIYPNID